MDPLKHAHLAYRVSLGEPWFRFCSVAKSYCAGGENVPFNLKVSR